MTASPAGEWKLRSVPPELVARYGQEGWWTDASIGSLVAGGLASLAGTHFGVYSQVRPWKGTFADLDRAARSFARSLRDRGVAPGDVVALQLPNWVEAAITFWGAAYAGAVVVPIVHFYGPREVDYILRVVQPAVVVTPDRFGRTDYLASYETLLGDRPPLWLVAGETLPEALPPGAEPFERVLDAAPVEAAAPVDPDMPALVAFTSGTTSQPKGVIHTHRTLGFEAHQLSAMTPPGGPPPITGAPVGHFIGMLSALVCSLLRSQAVYMVDVWDPGTVLRLMLEEHLGMAGGATYFLTSLLDHPDFGEEHLKLMPWCGLGGSAVPVAVTERATRLGIRVHRAYGSTEHPSITGSRFDEPEVKRVTTDGHPLTGVEVTLDDEGQILSRGPELFLGYTDPDLTARVFDDEGWYHTGDVGIMDDEGYLTITDRISDIIIRGGEKISAQEVEELVMGLEPVAEVSVVAAPDARLGEHAAAVVRIREGMTVPSLEDVRRHLAARGLARQKWPESIYAVDEFPRTASGKVQKFRLRNQLREGKLDGGRIA